MRRSVYGLCGLGIAMLALSRVFGFFYAFDEANRYYRIPENYWIITVIFLLILAILFAGTVRNRNYFQRIEYFALLALEIAPVIGVAMAL